jgi:hypothetical protein
MSFLIKSIKQIDFLSDKPELYINQTKRFQTLVGGILSTLTLMLVFSAGMNFSIALFQKKNSVIVYNQTPKENNTQQLNLPWIIMLQDQFFKPLTDEELLYDVKSNLWTASPDSSSGVITMSTSFFDVPLERCDLNIHFGIYRPYFANVPFLEHHYCPIPGESNVTLSGVYGSINSYTYLENWIVRCDNNTKINKRRKCYPKEIIDESLSNTIVSFKFLDYSINHSNNTQPGNLLLRSEALPVSTTIYKRNWLTLKNVVYNSDVGILFTDIRPQHFFQMGKFRETVDLRSEGSISGSFAQFTISMDSVEDTYTRAFTKGQETLANVGGLAKGVLIMSTVINFFLSQELYFIELIKCVFVEYSKNGLKHKISLKTGKFSFKLNASPTTKFKDVIINQNNKNEEQASKAEGSSIVNEVLIFNKNKTNINTNQSTPMRNLQSNFSNEPLALRSGPRSMKLNNKTINTPITERYEKPESQRRNENYNNKLSVLERVLPKALFRKRDTQIKLKNYNIVKNFITGQICLKNIISKMNEVEKLKFVLLTQEQLNLFNNIENPPLNYVLENKITSRGSIWGMMENRNSQFNQTVEAFYADILSRGSKSSIDMNLIKLLETFYSKRK